MNKSDHVPYNKFYYLVDYLLSDKINFNNTNYELMCNIADYSNKLSLIRNKYICNETTRS